MKLHELSPKNKKPSRKRRGQGNATGNGTFGGRGKNGQNARAGGGVRLGFEGGQTPLIRKMPKMKGFNNPNRVETLAINLDTLEATFQDGDKVDLAALVGAGLVTNPSKKVKILASGKLTKKLEISGIKTSETAKKAIEKAGGKVTK